MKRIILHGTACVLCIGIVLVGFARSMLHAASNVYPSKAINIVVPLPPGGVTDLSARLLAETMEKLLKQPMVIVNKPGGASTIGGYAVASAKPDGYTLGFFPFSATAPEVFSYFYVAPYTSNDFRPISKFQSPILTVAVRGDAPWNSLKEFVEYARKNPGTKYGHLGKGTQQYVVPSMIARQEHLRMVDVPYDGDATMIPALLGGHIPIATPIFPIIKSLVEAKKLKILAVVNDKRLAAAPDIPSLYELGYRTPLYAYGGLFAPKGTPDEIIKKLDETVRQASLDKDLQAKAKNMDLLLTYEDTATFEKSIRQYKEMLRAFFAEEGLIKGK
jgi:tripartite-type tricarboxylate transporter receptor subunit TctC